MSVARRWVFPILRIIIFAAIAVALVKIAFFADESTPTGGEFPTGEIVDPQVAVSRGTISNDIVLEGSVGPAPSRAIISEMTGEVRVVHKKNGDRVKKGDKIAEVRAVTVSDDGETTSTRWHVITAPTGGLLSGMQLFVGESVGAGSEVGKVTPTSFRVTASIPPAELYRLTNEPETATVTVAGGPAPFECSDLTIIAPSADDAEASTSMRCTVPNDVRVFAGLTAEVVISGGVAENVLVVPMTAVLGAADSGIVYAVLPDGGIEERVVTLGMNDGVFIEIKEGLEEGDMILEFVPGAPAGGGDGVIEPFPGEGRPGVIVDDDGVVIGEGG